MMYIVHNITTGDVIEKTSSFDKAIQAVREYLSKYTRFNDYEVDIKKIDIR